MAALARVNNTLRAHAHALLAGFRLYREIPADLLPASRASDRPDAAAAADGTEVPAGTAGEQGEGADAVPQPSAAAEAPKQVGGC